MTTENLQKAISLQDVISQLRNILDDLITMRNEKECIFLCKDDDNGYEFYKIARDFGEDKVLNELLLKMVIESYEKKLKVKEEEFKNL